MRPYLTQRQEEIVRLAKANGRVLVEELASSFGVTPQTIRKDLNELCNTGTFRRTHGGAVLASGTENLEYEQRRQIAADEKAEIGRAAASLIPNGGSLFINIGTTTEAVADALRNHEGLMVITNSINVANILRGFNKFEVVIAGGIVRNPDGGIVGEAAVDFIRQFKVDFAIVGASAIDPGGALLDFDFREVKVAQAIIENARKVILVSDSTKLKVSAPVRIADISQIDYLVTDRGLSPAFRNLCEQHEVDLVQVENPE